MSLFWGVGDTERLERASSGAHSSTTDHTNHKMRTAPPRTALSPRHEDRRMARAAVTPLEAGRSLITRGFGGAPHRTAGKGVPHPPPPRKAPPGGGFVGWGG